MFSGLGAGHETGPGNRGDFRKGNRHFQRLQGSAKTVQAGKERWTAIAADHVMGNSVQPDDQKFLAFFTFNSILLLLRKPDRWAAGTE
jgi:hypothetical protein